MRSLEQIEEEADFIATSSGTNFGHGERKLAALVSDLTNRLADAISVIDDLVSDHLRQAGIDMKPAYERMREIIDDRQCEAAAESPDAGTCDGCKRGWPTHIGSDGKPCHYEPGQGNGPTEHHPCTRTDGRLPVECVRCGAATGPLHPIDADHAGWLCPKCYHI